MEISIDELVRACYRSLLLREPDIEGLQHHVQLLSSGAMSASDLVASFVRCSEFQSAWQGDFRGPPSDTANKLTNDQSQFGEFELILQRWINESAKHCFIVDVGARGKERSNSYDLLKFFGWTALLIEANPALIEQINYDFRGLSYELINVAVSDYEGRSNFHVGVNDDVSSLTAEATLSWGKLTKTIEVEVRRLGGLLRERSIPLDFDLLSIDIEGEDIKVLEDLIRTTSYRPRWIIIEASNNYSTKSLDDLQVSAQIKSNYSISAQTPANLILKYVAGEASTLSIQSRREDLVTREQVESLYRLVLRRAPESTGAVDRWLGAGSFSDLLEIFIASDEYQKILAGAASHMKPSRDLSLTWPKLHIETRVDPKTMIQIFKHIGESWTELGENEPYYSVLSNPEYLKGSFLSNTETFFESGQGDIARLLSFASRAGVELPHEGACLELGCGVGRLTRWLSENFRKVIAVDISSAHINLARSNLADTLSSNEIDFVHLLSPTDIESTTGYDMFFSVIVLQHNPPPIIAYMLEKILNGLNRGGLAYFQVPTYKLDYSFSAKSYVKSLTNKGEMEMHLLPQAEIFRIGEQAGCKFLEVREDDYTGHTDGISNTFFLHKP